jgi:transketolase
MRALPAHARASCPPTTAAAQRPSIRLAAADRPAPFYVRLGRAQAVPRSLRRRRSAGARPAPTPACVREGTDATIVAACGVEVAQALAAADLLAERGHLRRGHRRVLASSPLDEDVICSSAAKTGHVVTCEEHMVTGGMGSAVAELLAQKNPTPMRFVGMRSFGTSAPGDVLLEHFGLDGKGIAAAVEGFLA